MQFNFDPETRKAKGAVLENEAELSVISNICSSYMLRMSHVLLCPVLHPRGGKFVPAGNEDRMRSLISGCMSVLIETSSSELPVSLNTEQAQFLADAVHSDEVREGEIPNPSISDAPENLPAKTGDEVAETLHMLALFDQVHPDFEPTTLS